MKSLLTALPLHPTPPHSTFLHALLLLAWLIGRGWANGACNKLRSGNTFGLEAQFPMTRRTWNKSNSNRLSRKWLKYIIFKHNRSRKQASWWRSLFSSWIPIAIVQITPLECHGGNQNTLHGKYVQRRLRSKEPPPPPPLPRPATSTPLRYGQKLSSPMEWLTKAVDWTLFGLHSSYIGCLYLCQVRRCIGVLYLNCPTLRCGAHNFGC